MVRVGIIGLGNIGRLHADRLEQLASERGEDIVLAGGMDTEPEVRDRFVDAFDVPVYQDADALLDTADAVIVTTPNQYHEQYATRALEIGCDVLVEKPLAHTVESAERIVEAVERSDAVCLVGFHNRFADPVEVLRTRQQNGQFGDIRHVEANYVRRRGIPGRGSWFTNRESAGGGALVDIGTHAVDLALHLLDFPTVREVSGVTRSQFGNRNDYAYLEMWGEDYESPFDVEDSASAFVRCADGATVSLEVAWASNRQPTNEFVVRGTEAGARYDLETGELSINEAAGDGAPHFTDTKVTTRSMDPHVSELRRFLEAVRSGNQPDRNTARQALTVQRVIDAIYRSDDRGRAIRLDG